MRQSTVLGYKLLGCHVLQRSISDWRTSGLADHCATPASSTASSFLNTISRRSCHNGQTNLLILVKIRQRLPSHNFFEARVDRQPSRSYIDQKTRFEYCIRNWGLTWAWELGIIAPFTCPSSHPLTASKRKRYLPHRSQISNRSPHSSPTGRAFPMLHRQSAKQKSTSVQRMSLGGGAQTPRKLVPPRTIAPVVSSSRRAPSVRELSNQFADH
jgi:hypothetical protein